MKNEIKSTAHSKNCCEYHIVFAPKYRRQEIYEQLKKDIGEILKKLCEQNGIKIIEAEACPNHISQFPFVFLMNNSKTEMYIHPEVA